MANLKYKGFSNPAEGSSGSTVISEVSNTYTTYFAKHGIVYNNVIAIFRGSSVDILKSSVWSTSIVFTDGMGAGESSCVFNNRLYVAGTRTAGGLQSNIYYTTDFGVANPANWTAATVYFNNADRVNPTIAASSNLLMCASGSSEVLNGSSPQLQVTSYPGDTFTNITSNLQLSTGISASLTGIAYGNGKFVISTLDGKVTTCTDSFPIVFGNTTTLNSYSLGARVKVTFDASTNKFYAYCRSNNVAGKYSNIFSSPDGINWTDISINLPEVLQVDAVYSIGSFLYAYTATAIYSSSDSGITWVLSTSNLQTANFATVSVGKNLAYVAYGISGSNSGTAYKQLAVDYYGTNPSTVNTTSAKNSPLKGVEFDSNVKSLNTNKLETSGYNPGNILYSNASGNLTQLAPGVSGNTLNISSSFPIWSIRDQFKVSIQEYQTPGNYTWSKPAGVKAIYLYMVGAGGGGGGGRMSNSTEISIIATGGGGGGGAGVTELMFKADEINAPLNITVGSGGAGGTGGYQLGNGNAPTSGLSGGDSSFGPITATGGGGGESGTVWTPPVASGGPLTYNLARGGSSGVLPLYGKHDIAFAPGTNYYDVDLIIPIGGGAPFTLNFNPDQTLPYEGINLSNQQQRQGNNGKRSPGGGGAGGYYFKFENDLFSNTAVTGGASGGNGFWLSSSYFEDVVNSESTSYYNKDRVLPSPILTTKIDVNTFTKGGNLDDYYLEGASPQIKSGGRRGAGGSGGVSGGYTLNYSGSGGSGYYPGGGGGGGGGCFALSGITSRAGNGGRGGDGYVLVVSIF